MVSNSPLWMKLADHDGNVALCSGNCNLAFEGHDYKATPTMMALQMNSDLDANHMLLGCDCLRTIQAGIMYTWHMYMIT